MTTLRYNKSSFLISIVVLYGLSFCFADALPLIFTAELQGEQVVPPVDTDASGQLRAVLVEDELVIIGNYAGLSSDIFGEGNINAASVQLHNAMTGETGSLVRSDVEQSYNAFAGFRLLHDGGIKGSFTGVFKLSDNQIQELKQGMFYLNIITESQLRGELRGQLMPAMKIELDTSDLVGLWEVQNPSNSLHYQFNDNGTYEVFRSKESEIPTDQGTYSLEQNNITLISNKENYHSCSNNVEKYTVMSSEVGKLRFFPIENNCPAKVAFLNGFLVVRTER